MKDETTRMYIGAKVPGLIRSSEPMTDFSEVIGRGEQLPTSTNYVPARTIGPTAKERERARLHAGTRPRKNTSRPGARARGAGRPKAQSTRSSARSGDSGDDDPSDEPPPRRFCENQRCQADISHRSVLAYYCDDACQQQAYRDRRTLELLDEDAGTIAEGLSCICEPRHGEAVPHNLLEDGHCLKCGCPRGIVTRGWVTDRAPQARTLVVMRGLPPREVRVRPDRELSTKLRRTRRDRKVVA